MTRVPPEIAVAQRGAATRRRTIEEIRKYDPAFTHEHDLPGFVTALRTEEWKYVSSDGERALYRLPVEFDEAILDRLADLGYTVD